MALGLRGIEGRREGRREGGEFICLDSSLDARFISIDAAAEAKTAVQSHSAITTRAPKGFDDKAHAAASATV